MTTNTVWRRPSAVEQSCVDDSRSAAMVAADGALRAVRPAGGGDVVATNPVWRLAARVPSVHRPALSRPTAPRGFGAVGGPDAQGIPDHPVVHRLGGRRTEARAS